jgi:hypothetical protein
MQARPVKAASGSDLAQLTAIGNLGVNARPAGFGREATDARPGSGHSTLPCRLNITTIIGVQITFDRAKRAKTLAERILDFRRGRSMSGS